MINPVIVPVISLCSFWISRRHKDKSLHAWSKVLVLAQPQKVRERDGIEVIMLSCLVNNSIILLRNVLVDLSWLRHLVKSLCLRWCELKMESGLHLGSFVSFFNKNTLGFVVNLLDDLNGSGGPAVNLRLCALEGMIRKWEIEILGFYSMLF